MILVIFTENHAWKNTCDGCRDACERTTYGVEPSAASLSEIGVQQILGDDTASLQSR